MHLVEAIGEEHPGRDPADVGRGVDAVDQTAEPVRGDGGVVVDEGEVVVRPMELPDPCAVADAEIAPAGEAEVGERFEHRHVGHLGSDPFGDVVERTVVDEHDLQPVARPVEFAERAQAGHRQLTAVEGQHHDAHHRQRRRCSAHGHRRTAACVTEPGRWSSTVVSQRWSAIATSAIPHCRARASAPV